MTIQPTYLTFRSKRKMHLWIITGTFAFLCTNMVLDFWVTVFQKSSFFISESLLFSTYWLLFLPMIALFIKAMTLTHKNIQKFFLVGAASVIQLFSYAAWIWLVSKTLYVHTFDYWQTFHFGLSAYFIKTIIIYSFSALGLSFYYKRHQTPSTRNKTEENIENKNLIRSILVADRHHRKVLLQTTDIFYCAANSPYIEIYHSSKKYLHTDTLKSLETKLDQQQFVRIHKSHIVNMAKISSMQSRQNGDYDISLSDGTLLRLSRHYAKNFRVLFERHTQHTTL